MKFLPKLSIILLGLFFLVGEKAYASKLMTGDYSCDFFSAQKYINSPFYLEYNPSSNNYIVNIREAKIKSVTSDFFEIRISAVNSKVVLPKDDASIYLLLNPKKNIKSQLLFEIVINKESRVFHINSVDGRPLKSGKCILK